MTEVLVTGGTGALGREVVPRLVAAGAQVRVLTRRADAVFPDGATAARGDLLSGEGLPEALAGVDAIAHCASGPPNTKVDTAGTRNLLDAATAAGVSHILYVSIVGVDRLTSFFYYRAKLEAERIVAGSGLGHTILRATQFHDLVLQALAALAKPPAVAFVPKGVSAQPVDTRDVAERLVPLVLGEPAGWVPDMGGPYVEHTGDLMRTYLEAADLRRRIVPVPLPGTTMRGFRAGAHMPVSGTMGTRGFADFVRERVAPGGHVEFTYYRRRRT